MNQQETAGLAAWRHKLHEVIFESETFAGKAFDIGLFFAIGVSVLVVMLESVSSIRSEYGGLLRGIEWGLTFLFTLEYLLRLIAVNSPWKYTTSFYGVVDLLAILPSYISYFVDGTHYMIAIRILRILRIFRVLKLSLYLEEAGALLKALRASRRKIELFLVTVVSIVVVLGSLMYFIEGEEHGFTSIPTSIYWAVVTMTTVGYGDISPKTIPGQALASVVMILGYGILAVPTGIVSSELVKGSKKEVSTQACKSCHQEDHDVDARYCKHCGAPL